MESNGWSSAVELQQQLDDIQSKLTAAEDRIVDLERVRRHAQTVVREWPFLRDRVVGRPEPHVEAFSERVSYLAQAIEGRESVLPPSPRAPVAGAEYLQEVLLELWDLAREWKSGQKDSLDDPVDNCKCQNCRPLHVLGKMFGILETAVEGDAPETQPDGLVREVLIPAGHQWLDPEVHGPSEASKSVGFRRLRAEDDGPTYPDSDGAPECPEPVADATRTLVGKPVEGHPGIFTVEFSQVEPHQWNRMLAPKVHPPLTVDKRDWTTNVSDLERRLSAIERALGLRDGL